VDTFIENGIIGYLVPFFSKTPKIEWPFCFWRAY